MRAAGHNWRAGSLAFWAAMATLAGYSSAGTFTWDGGGGAANPAWGTAGNWVNDALPLFDGSDDITFATGFASGTTTSLGNVTRTINSLTSSTQTAFTIGTGTLVLNSGLLTRTAAAQIGAPTPAATGTAYTAAQVTLGAINLGNDGLWTNLAITDYLTSGTNAGITGGITLTGSVGSTNTAVRSLTLAGTGNAKNYTNFGSVFFINNSNIGGTGATSTVSSLTVADGAVLGQNQNGTNIYNDSMPIVLRNGTLVNRHEASPETIGALTFDQAGSLVTKARTGGTSDNTSVLTFITPSIGRVANSRGTLEISGNIFVTGINATPGLLQLSSATSAPAAASVAATTMIAPYIVAQPYAPGTGSSGGATFAKVAASSPFNVVAVDTYVSSLSTNGTDIVSLSADTAVVSNADVLALRVVTTSGAVNLTGTSAITLQSGGLLFDLVSSNSAVVNPNLSFAQEAAIFVNNTPGGKSATIAGAVDGGNGLTKFGTGQLILSNAANLWTGSTVINNGRLTVSAGNGVHGTALTVNQFGTFDMRVNQTVAGLDGGGRIAVGVAVPTSTLTIDKSTGTSTFSGVFENTSSASDARPDIVTLGTVALNVAKQGNGTQIFSGTNRYTGTTAITAGTLQMNGSHVGGAAYTVSGTGILGGSGSITTAGNAGVTVSSGGGLSPGAGVGKLTMDLGTGTLDVSGAVAAATPSMHFDLATASASDGIVLTNGILNIGSGVLNFDDFDFVNQGGITAATYTLFDTNSSIIGSLGTNLSGTVGGFSATLALADGGTNLVLNTPEPTGIAPILLCSAMVVLKRSRRRASTQVTV
jgi:autotransporter-associated beta strand protein